MNLDLDPVPVTKIDLFAKESSAGDSTDGPQGWAVKRTVDDGQIYSKTKPVVNGPLE
jgi:hypothetical protein